MSAFADSTDLAARLGLVFTDDEVVRADALLEIASGLIQDEAKQTILLVTDDVVILPGTTDQMVKLPQRPVVSVTSVTLDGAPLGEGTFWYLNGNAIERVPVSSVVLAGDQVFTFPFGTGFGWAGFGWPTQTLEITYTHGYADADIPKSVKAIALEMVTRAWVNPGSIARETVAGVTTVFDNMRFSPTGLLLTDDEKGVIRRLFGRSGRSITIGR